MNSPSAAPASTYRARFEQASLPQATLDLSGRVATANAALAALLDRGVEDLVGCELRALVSPSADPLAGQRWEAVLAGGEPSAHFEDVLVGRDGAGVPVHVALSRLHDEAGQPLGTAVFLHDLTDVRRAARQSQRHDAYVDSLSRLAGDVALVGSAAGELVYVSPAAERVLGYTQGELLGEVGFDFVHPDDRAGVQQTYADVVRSGGTLTFRFRLRHADGSFRWMEETATNRLQDPVGGIVCNLRDVHDQVLSELELAASEARFRAIAETASEGIWLVTPQGRTLFANARMADILGLPLHLVYGRQATSLLDPAAAAVMTERLSTRSARGAERYEVDVVHPGGERRCLAIAASPLPGPDGTTLGSLAMVSDVTEARRVENELRRAALHDALTGLPNRALLLDRLEQSLARDHGRTAVAFLDLDRFKLVNDSRGHDVGDELLLAVAGRLSGAVRPQDTVARFGGDEFVVLAEDMDEDSAHVLGQQLLDALLEPVVAGGVKVHVDASVGIALSPPVSPVDLLRYADSAMYAAKSAGRGRVRLFDPALASAAEEHYALSERLREALTQDRLAMHYQPIVELASGRVLGVEALARWSDPEHGEIGPDRFVPIAESSGLSPVLDRWAVARALADARVLRRAGVLPVEAYVSVNLSASNVADRQLEDFIVTETAASGLSPRHLVLEVTEGSIMTDADVAIPLLRRLRARGFRLAIDDFGTGQSSLAYLRDLPIDHLKIDRSFIDGLREDTDALAVAASIVDLGRAVGMTVVAEGVTEAQQASLLRSMGCQAAQGWLWSKALPTSEVLLHRPWSDGFGTAPRAEARPAPRRAGRPRADSRHGLDRILAMHSKGASLATIAASLNRDGYLTPAGLRWHHTSVARAVADAAYPDLAAHPSGTTS